MLLREIFEGLVIEEKINIHQQIIRHGRLRYIEEAIETVRRIYNGNEADRVLWKSKADTYKESFNTFFNMGSNPTTSTTPSIECECEYFIRGYMYKYL